MKTRALAATAALVAFAGSAPALAATHIYPTSDAQALADAFLGPDSAGVVITHVSYQGHAGAAGTFVDGPDGIADGILLTSGLANYALPPNDYKTIAEKTSVAGVRHNLPGDLACTDLMVAGSSFDAAKLTLEFDVLPGYEGVRFNMVFGTDEYPDFVGQVYNDVFSARLTSADGSVSQIALDAGGDPITINGPFFSSARVVRADANGTEYDGSTALLSSQGALQGGSIGNVLELVVCDGYDDLVDSGVFLSGITGCIGGDCDAPTRPCEEVDGDGDGINACQDCNDANPSLPAPDGSCALADEVCDGVDNDYDGQTDEGFDADADGIADCFDVETCDGLDNDGDGQTDEGYDADHDGVADCFDPEICDGHDNDGDGRIDEGFDADHDGTPDCADAEVCDGADNDGDGQTDEGFDADHNGAADCLEGGDPGGDPEDCAKARYPWSEFVASASELVPGLPSDQRPEDTRAGSLEYNTNGGEGFNDNDDDPPYHAAILTLRNGAGDLVEQLQLNRRWPPTLDASGCNPATSTPQCWQWNQDRIVGAFTLPGVLTNGHEVNVELPERSTDSNDGFDGVSGSRVTVSGGLHVDYDTFTGVDNGHQTLYAQWEVPAGRTLRQETDLLFRGRYDWGEDGLGDEDRFFTLFHIDGTDPGHTFAAPGVSIVEETPSRLLIAINVQTALERVRDHYAGTLGLPVGDACAPAPVVFKWDEFVASAAERWPGLPSDSYALDTRAGSVEYNANAGYGFSSWTDPAFGANILSLRNGAGVVVEQVHSNRARTPALNGDDCNVDSPFPQCFIWGDDTLAVVPDRIDSSNVAFDSSGRRVTVGGTYEIDGDLATGFDQYHQTLTATFEVPAGRKLLPETQFKLRGRYDWDCNGLGNSDPLIVLFENDRGALSAVDGVEIVEQTTTSMTLQINKQRALNAVRDTYERLGFNFGAVCH